MATKVPKVKSMEEVKYYKALENAAKNQSPKQLMRSQWIKIIIQRILSARELMKTVGKEKLPAAIKETLCTYDVLDRDGQNVLILKATELETNKIIVALEDSYEVVSQAHEVTNHGSIVQMTNCLSQSNFVVHEICLSTFIENCFTCNNSTKNVLVVDEPVSQDPVIAERLALIDLMDMTLHGSTDFSYLMVYQDFNTKFVQLRPLTTPNNMNQEISLELIRLFADMGAPYCIKVLRPIEPMFGEILDKVNLFLNTNITLVKHSIWDRHVNEAFTTVTEALKDWMIRNSNRCWSMGCFFIQWEINNCKNESGTTPFVKLYGRQPNKFETPVNKEIHIAESDIPDNTLERPNVFRQLEELNLHEEADLGIFTDSDIKEEAQDEIKEEIHDEIVDTEMITANEDNDPTIIKFDEDFEGMNTSLVKIDSSNVPEVSTDTSNFKCSECKKPILSNVYTCTKCNQCMHLYCGKKIQGDNNCLQYICFSCAAVS